MSHREREVIGVDDRVSPARAIPLGDYTLPGMATSTLVGIILNLVLPQEKKGDAAAQA